MKKIVKRVLSIKSLFLGLFLASLGLYSCATTKYGAPADRFVEAEQAKTECEFIPI